MIKSLFTNSDYDERSLKFQRFKKLRDVKNGSEYIGKGIQSTMIFKKSTDSLKIKINF